MNPKKVWRELLEIAKEYYDEDKIFYSKTKRGIYRIEYFNKDKIVIKLLKGKSEEVLGKKRFLDNFDNLVYGVDWNVSPAIKSFLKLHPKIEEKDGVLILRY
ncbi:hypothetical protein ACPB8Q_05795 [Methanocaldococcus indicus]|uniref:hypothetical protein n=1 Tax=Methanocaldococcus indicus TaxID=213231 RepID=UPI003C6D82C7